MTYLPSTKMICLIKPYSIRRGLGTYILEDILNLDDIVISRFRSWHVCGTTWSILQSYQPYDDIRKKKEEDFREASYGTYCWSLKIESSREDLFSFISAQFGPDDISKLLPKHLRYKHSIAQVPLSKPHMADTVFYIPPEDKMDIVEALVF